MVSVESVLGHSGVGDCGMAKGSLLGPGPGV
jgi:hypothetical protein